MRSDAALALLPSAAITRSVPSIAAREAQIRPVPERGERGKRIFSCPLPLLLLLLLRGILSRMQPDAVPMLLPPAAFTRSMSSIAAREAQIQTVPERG